MKNNYQELENESHAIHIIDQEMNQFNDINQSYNNGYMFKLGRLIEGMKCKIINMQRNDFEGINSNIDDSKRIRQIKLVEEGIDVEILKVGALGWQKGKLRLKVSVEFCPEKESNSENI
jgi:hypothetical protein